MEDTRTAGQWAIMPAMIRYDRGLPANAKLIYAEIAAKINEEGYCYAHNRYFAERFGLKEDTVSSLIKRLADAEYIALDLDTARLNTDRRRIYLTGKPYDFTGGIGFKSGTGQKSEGVPDLNPIPIENSNLKSIPPKPPEGAKRERKKRGPKKEAAWRPEKFAAFWAAYPRGEAKQRAIAAWDALRPDSETLLAMARGLKRALASEEWQRGIGIPYASTWLNQQRWTDECVQPNDSREAAAPMPGGELEIWS